MGILPTIDEQDDEVVVIEAPTIPAELTISQVPSISEVRSEGQQPTVTQVPPSSDWASVSVERPPSQRQDTTTLVMEPQLVRSGNLVSSNTITGSVAELSDLA
ncbi:hypothetical protein COCNU_08G005280 [Cocos nucifera]|uniref:Uncharacterized protein n=1 Tax=Cocos nucifera TaxID=13894 RepID=A0A8K0N6P6_COCNU|nr:hypothetical protein COCNU_08G005280 [Cocos nucifera]